MDGLRSPVWHWMLLLCISFAELFHCFKWKAAICQPRGKVTPLGFTGVLQAEGAVLICYLDFSVALFVEILQKKQWVIIFCEGPASSYTGYSGLSVWSRPCSNLPLPHFFLGYIVCQVKIPPWVTQEEADGVWRLYASISVTSSSGLCRGHTLSWAEETLQLGFLMIRFAQIGVPFLSAVHSMHRPMDLPYFCSFWFICFWYCSLAGQCLMSQSHPNRIDIPCVKVSDLEDFFLSGRWLKDVFQCGRWTIILKGIAKNIARSI